MEREVFSKTDNRLAPWVGLETEHAAELEVGDDDARAILAKCDDDGDGLLDRGEAIVALAAWRQLATVKVDHCATCQCVVT